MKTKNLLIAFILLFAFTKAHSQEITFDVMTYNSGYNVTCYGAANGAIDATIVGGTAPYTYTWSNGAHFEDLLNIPAGSYTLTVTDHNGNHSSKAIKLNQPEALTAILYPHVYDGGYNISQTGGNDGSIQTQVKGGTSSYNYVWSNSSTSDNIADLTAGTYNVTVTDQNGCTATGSATLTEPTPLHIVSITAANHNGYNVSCSRGSNGSINLTVAGGTSPYQYNWSNGAFVEDPDRLPAGLYMVEVIDRNGAKAQGQITLTEPNDLSVSLTASNYSGYNISCNSCSNGTLHTTVTGGTAAYSYVWSSGQTSANVYNLGVGEYYVTVTDANGCSTSSNHKQITEPATTGWGLHGNTGDTTNVMGTTNNVPLSFETNDSVRMMIKTNGDVLFKRSLLFGGGGQLRFTPASGNTGSHFLFMLSGAPTEQAPFYDGCLHTFNIGTKPSLDFHGLFRSGAVYPSQGGQQLQMDIMTMGCDGSNGIIDVSGDHSATGGGPDLLINTLCGHNVYMCNATSGIVSIGCTYNNQDYKLSVNGKIIAEELNIKLYGNGNGWPDYVFEKPYKLRSIEELKAFTQKEKHLPEMPTAKEVEKNGINTSEMITKLLKQQEELTQYVIQLNEQNKELKKEIELLKK